MTGERSAMMERHASVVHHQDAQGKQTGHKPTPRERTAELLSEAIVELYRLSGWPPWRVAAELSVGVGSREDVLRWARDGVLRRHRDTLFDRVEQLQRRFRPARCWGPERVRRLRQRVGCRLDLALEVGVDLEEVRAWERGEERPTQRQAETLEGLEHRETRSAPHSENGDNSTEGT